MRQERESKSPVYLLLSLGLFAVLCIFTVLYSLERTIAGDEGYYLLAAELVREGKIPYLDFFYPQMPLLPYAYAAPALLSDVIGRHTFWITGRLMSAVITLLLGFLVFRVLNRGLGRPWALAGATALILSVHAAPWFLTAQTYAFGTLCLFAAFLLADRKAPTASSAFFAGCCFGLAVLTRLPLAAVGPLVLWQVWLRADQESRARNLLMTVLGGGLVSIPVIALFAADPEVFWFNNFEYHTVRSGLGLQQLQAKRIHLIGLLTGFRTAKAFSGYELPILFWITCGGVIALRAGSTGFFAALYGLTLLAVHLIPAPPYSQYFCHAVPFLIVGSAAFLHDGGPWRRIAGVAVTVAFFAFVPVNVRKFTSNDQALGLARGVDADDWKPREFARSAKRLNQLIGEEQPGVSFWSGFFVGTVIRPVLGSENHFGRNVAAKLPPGERSRLRIYSQAEVMAAIRSARITWFFLRDSDIKRPTREALKRGQFSIFYSDPPLTLWHSAAASDAPASLGAGGDE